MMLNDQSLPPQRADRAAGKECVLGAKGEVVPQQHCRLDKPTMLLSWITPSGEPANELTRCHANRAIQQSQIP